MKLALPVLVVAALCWGAPAAAAAPEVSTLDPLPGHTSSSPVDMNDSGVVVGQSYANVGCLRPCAATRPEYTPCPTWATARCPSPSTGTAPPSAGC